MTIVTLRHPPGTAGTIRGAGEKRAVGRISRCGHTIAQWIERSRQRRALRDIAEVDYLLEDIGVSREEAFHEAGKPFWRP
jgi:uncharacterized protein YjiS (DUF1127 family)